MKWATSKKKIHCQRLAPTAMTKMILLFVLVDDIDDNNCNNGSGNNKQYRGGKKSFLMHPLFQLLLILLILLPTTKSPFPSFAAGNNNHDEDDIVDTAVISLPLVKDSSFFHPIDGITGANDIRCTTSSPTIIPNWLVFFCIISTNNITVTDWDQNTYGCSLIIALLESNFIAVWLVVSGDDIIDTVDRSVFVLILILFFFFLI